MSLIIGVDPGLGGGIAIVGEGNDAAWKMPETLKDLLDLLIDIMATKKVVHCYLERVSSSPQMGVVSAFKFGYGYGGLEAMIIANEIPLTKVSPQVWQKVMGCRSGGDKNVTKRRAQELFPELKITHAIADALLIAKYGQITEQRVN